MSKLDLKPVIIGVLLGMGVLVIGYIITIYIGLANFGYTYLYAANTGVAEPDMLGCFGIIFAILFLSGVVSFWAYLILRKIKKQ